MPSLLGLVLIANMMAAPYATTADTDSISAIRASYTEIERALPHCRQTRHDLMGFSSEGGELVAYFDTTGAGKLSAVYFGEMGRSKEEYFFARGALIFVLVVDERYDQPLSGHVVNRSAQRFYFQDGRLIRWLDTGRHPRDPRAHDALERGNRLLTQSRQLVACATAKSSDDARCEGTD